MVDVHIIHSAVRADKYVLALKQWTKAELIKGRCNCNQGTFPGALGCMPIEHSAPDNFGGICCNNNMPGHLF